jgi:acetyl-CoA carboxylase biotin carboxyl carrier protein
VERAPAVIPAAAVQKVSAPEPAKESSVKTVEIKSPMVGTFYRAPSPEAAPYVEVGQVVEPGQVICIVEAMKLMNEIKAEVKGKILEILADNAEPVEFGQPMFLIEPLK